RGIVPPTLHCETPNPKIPFDGLNLRLVRRAETIAAGRGAGGNSFGFGGTHGHAVLAAPSHPGKEARVAGGPVPRLIWAARTKAPLRAVAGSGRDTPAATPADRGAGLLRAAARRRDQHPHRLAILGEHPDGAAAALTDFIAGVDSAAAVTGTA